MTLTSPGYSASFEMRSLFFILRRPSATLTAELRSRRPIGSFAELRECGEEFKEFALKGNALSLAIGVIIGAAFGKIVDALVNDIIMPIIGIAGKADFSNYYLPLSSAVKATNLSTRESKAACSPMAISSLS